MFPLAVATFHVETDMPADETVSQAQIDFVRQHKEVVDKGFALTN